MTNHEELFTWKGLMRVVVVGIGLLLAWKALGVFVNILIALILAVAIYPLAKKLSRKLPWLLSIIIVLVVFLVPFIFIGIFVIPNLVAQSPALLGTIRSILDHATFLPGSVRSFDLAQYINQHTSDILASSKTVALAIVSVVEVFFMMFYFMLDHERLLHFFLDLFPQKERNKIKGMLVELGRVNGQYIRGNVIISLICTAVVIIALTILRVPYALPLAIFAGILDLLPLVGGTLGAIPAVIIAFTVSPLTGILVIVIHLLYQQAENAIISPLIYNKALNLSPALSFLAVVLGGGLFGIPGAFLALPVAASIPSAIAYYRGYTERNG